MRDLPGVGANLQDHMLLGVGYEATRPLDFAEMLAEAGLFTWTDAADRNASPNLQYFFGPIEFVPDEYRTTGPGFTAAPILAQPKSIGTVTLASADPRRTPWSIRNISAATKTLRCSNTAYGMPASWCTTKPFDPMRGRELAPGAERHKQYRSRRLHPSRRLHRVASGRHLQDGTGQRCGGGGR